MNYNFTGTLLAYGQTSSGKTYTMQGSASDPGVIRLAIHDVFINIDKVSRLFFVIQARSLGSQMLVAGERVQSERLKFWPRGLSVNHKCKPEGSF